MQIDDGVLARQVTDTNASVELEDIVTGWSDEKAKTYYLTLERRIIGANVLLDHVGRRAWLLGEAEDSVEQLYDTTAERWHAIARLLPFEVAHALASTARERREKIREAVSEKLVTRSDSPAQSEVSD